MGCTEVSNICDLLPKLVNEVVISQQSTPAHNPNAPTDAPRKYTKGKNDLPPQGPRGDMAWTAQHTPSFYPGAKGSSVVKVNKAVGFYDKYDVGRVVSGME